ncbi:MAG: acetolactate synthase large subunit, partial [Rikenellaceae bacterium]|nr:acetolactate synthase large subunit [Rikenellaceae bacterium]
MNEKRLMTGGEAMLEILLREGVDTIFGYPGGGIMPFYNSLYDYTDRIRHILMRHEQGCVHAAQGYARTSGRVGVCTVTSGPGATNTITGLADAMLDSTPLVVISGQVPVSLLGSDAFQEVNFVGLAQVVTKWTCQIKHASEIADVMARAFYIARSGRPGPVAIDFTKNAQQEMVELDYKPLNFIRGYVPSPEPNMEQIKEAAKLINEAQKPMALVGQGITLAGAEAELDKFLRKSGIPAGATMLGLSAVPSDHPNYLGMLGMHGCYAANIKNDDCDLLIALGMRFDDRVTCDVKKYGRNAKVVHLEID